MTSRRPKAIFQTMQERRVSVMLLVPQALDLFKKGIEREIERQNKYAIFAKLMAISRKSPKSLRQLLVVGYLLTKPVSTKWGCCCQGSLFKAFTKFINKSFFR